MEIGDAIALRDKAGEPLGEVTIREWRDGAWCGDFSPGGGYGQVRELFVEWTRWVNEQSFSLLDVQEDRITALGISVFHGSACLPVGDVQIFDEGNRLEGGFKLMACVRLDPG